MLGVRTAGHRGLPGGGAGPARRRAGGCLTAVYNAANEEAAAAFLAGRISFPAIVRTIADVLADADEWAAEPATVDDVLDAQRWARERARRAVTQEVMPTR
ncbi:DXP reductoisomerase C-terminal domain protein [Mycobacterium xenopi 4042]|uniref:DXP reductoisomerase C-terminal domain protein n=1 Tax=Mycobacterium xenopi 4042 TaxID=1299334 RepID=X8E984_MYCXE|nr:DXP reductoisomerase C-terminal domain protein [Mycobacterium xenopi 4042]